MNQTLNILIVEDNFSFALELEITIKELDHNLISIVDNSGDALVEILDKKPDLILMDIDIKGKLSGLDIAEKISHLKIPIIFITSFANDEHYDKAESIFYSTYIIKPVDKYTLKAAINLLMRSSYKTLKSSTTTDFNFKNGDLYLKSKNDFYRIEIGDIIIIESDRVYCKTILINANRYHNRISLQEYSKHLNTPNFIKPHRSYIININHIKKVNIAENTIIMKNDFKVPISRSAKNDIKSIMKMIN